MPSCANDDDGRLEEPEPFGWRGVLVTTLAIVAAAVVIYVFEIGKPKPPRTDYRVIEVLVPGSTARCNFLLIQYGKDGHFYCGA